MKIINSGLILTYENRVKSAKSVQSERQKLFYVTFSKEVNDDQFTVAQLIISLWRNLVNTYNNCIHILFILKTNTDSKNEERQTPLISVQSYWAFGLKWHYSLRFISPKLNWKK